MAASRLGHRPTMQGNHYIARNRLRAVTGRVRRHRCCRLHRSKRRGRRARANRSLYPSIVMATDISPEQRHRSWIPKIGTPLEHSVLEKLTSATISVANFMGQTEHRIFCRTSGGLCWEVLTDFAPAFRVNEQQGSTSRETSFSVSHPEQVQPLIVSLSSDIF